MAPSVSESAPSASGGVRPDPGAGTMPDLTLGRSLVRRWRTGAAPGSAAEPGPRPLTQAQHGIWFFEQLHPDGAVFNLGYAADHRGGLLPERLDRAVATLLDRHAALR